MALKRKRPGGDLTPRTPPVKRKGVPPALDVSTGPLCDRTGAVRVDRERFPTLYRALDVGLAPFRARREQWAEVAALHRAGRHEAARDLSAELLGVVPKETEGRARVPIETLPSNVQELLAKLKALPAADRAAAGRIRAELRRLGHKGGLRAAK